MPLFSVLIPTLACRAGMLAHLLAALDPQVAEANAGGPRVEVITALDDGGRTIGEKRNRLLAEAIGGGAEYAAFVDDDDLISPSYVARVLDALDRRPDCVGFKVLRSVDGSSQDEAIHSLRYAAYGEHQGADGRRVFERTPNHLNPVRVELARAAGGFPELNWGEDTDYATRLRPLLRTEVFIDQYLYTYLYRTPHRRRGERVNAAWPGVLAR